MLVDTTSVPTLIANASHAIVARENEAVATSRNAEAIPIASQDVNLMLKVTLLWFVEFDDGTACVCAERKALGPATGRTDSSLERPDLRGIPSATATSSTNANGASDPTKGDVLFVGRLRRLAFGRRVLNALDPMDLTKRVRAPSRNKLSRSLDR
jgi:hypothetical protein